MNMWPELYVSRMRQQRQCMVPDERELTGDDSVTCDAFSDVMLTWLPHNGYSLTAKERESTTHVPVCTCTEIYTCACTCMYIHVGVHVYDHSTWTHLADEVRAVADRFQVFWQRRLVQWQAVAVTGSDHIVL